MGSSGARSLFTEKSVFYREILMRLPEKTLHRWVVIFCVLLVAVAMGACAEDDDNSNLLANTGNVEENDNQDEKDNQDEQNQNNQEDPCADVECAADEVCFEGQCEPAADPGYGCHEPTDIGELSADDSQEVTADATGQPNVVSTTCGSEHEESPQAVFSFTVDEPMEIDISIEDSTDPLVIEIREDSCRDEEAATSCDNAFEQTHYAIPGVTYYVVVEPVSQWNLGEFTLSFETSGLVCAPPGAWSCDDDIRVQCFAGVEERTYECGADCVDGECLGEGCHNPIEVTGSITVEGDVSAYDSSGRFDFSDSPACSTQGTSGPTTSGQDLLFSLPGLLEGQTVIVDALDSPTINAIGILDECDEENTQCIAGNDTDQLMEWTVPADGDYFVVVNQFATSNGRFIYSVEIVD